MQKSIIDLDRTSKYQGLQFSLLGIVSNKPASSAAPLQITSPPNISFSVEDRILAHLQREQKKKVEKADKRSKFLQARDSQLREDELSEWQRIEEQQKAKQEEARIHNERKQVEARIQAAKKQEEARLYEVKKKEEAARERDRIAQAEARKVSVWQNAQLDLTGQLLEKYQVDAVRNFQAVCGVEDDFKSIKLVMLVRWDANAAINYFLTAPNLDAAIARVAPAPAVPKARVTIKLPSEVTVVREFAGDDSLWVLEAAVAELVHPARYTMMNVDSSYCFSYPEANLNKSFAQSGLFPTGTVIVKQRPDA